MAIRSRRRNPRANRAPGNQSGIAPPPPLEEPLDDELEELLEDELLEELDELEELLDEELDEELEDDELLEDEAPELVSEITVAE